MWTHEKARHAASNEAASFNSNPQDIGAKHLGQMDLGPQNLGRKPHTGSEAIPRLRCDGWTLTKQRRFCELLAECGEVETVSRAVGMTRQTAYRLRCRKAGKAFALAWDAAMLIASRVMIDDAVLMTFHGSVEKSVRVGNTITKHRRTPAMLFATAERLRSPRILGSPTVVAASEDWERCLDLLEQGQVYCAEDDSSPVEPPPALPAPNPPPQLTAPRPAASAQSFADDYADAARPLVKEPSPLPLTRAQRRVMDKNRRKAVAKTVKAATARAEGVWA
jgi:hypothetical protein